MSAVTGIGDVAGTHFAYIHVPGNETAGTGTIAGHWVAPFNCNVTSVQAVASAAVTGADTNTRHLNVDLPSGTEVATRDLASGTDMTANTVYTLYSTSTALTNGQVCTFENELVGTGQAIPGGFTIILEYEPT